MAVLEDDDETAAARAAMEKDLLGRLQTEQGTAATQRTDLDFNGPQERADLKDSLNDNAAARGFLAASNKIGSVGGKTASPSAFAGYSNDIDAHDTQDFKARQAMDQDLRQKVLGADELGMKTIDQGVKADADNKETSIRQKMLEESDDPESDTSKMARQLGAMKIRQTVADMRALGRTADAEKLELLAKGIEGNENHLSAYQLEALVKQHGIDLSKEVEAKMRTDATMAAARAQADVRREVAQTRADAQAERAAQAKGDKTLKRVTDLKKDLDYMKGRNGEFGAQAAKLDQAMALNKLTDGNANLTEGETQELASGVNNLLSRGTPGQEAMKHLVPSSAWGDAHKIIGWLTNNPTGLEQQAFVKRMMNTVKREADNSRAIIRGAQLKKAATYSDLRNNPDTQHDFEEALRIHGLSLQDYDDLVAGKGPNVGTPGSQPGTSGKPGAPSAAPQTPVLHGSQLP